MYFQPLYGADLGGIREMIPPGHGVKKLGRVNINKVLFSRSITLTHFI